MGRMESHWGSQTNHWVPSRAKTCPRQRISITQSEETLELVLPRALDVDIRGGSKRRREVLLVAALLALGLNLDHNLVRGVGHDAVVQRDELFLDRSRVVARLLKLVGAHDEEEVIVRLAVNLLLATALQRHLLLNLRLDEVLVGDAEEAAVEVIGRLALVHDLREL
jgi:hypothetical protein